MKILFITHYFQPEANAFFGLPFAKELVRRGHTVQVVTGFPNYPGGRIFHGYRGKLFMRENMEGIDVIRFPLFPSHDNSSFKRILCYCSLSASIAAIAPFIVHKADVSYVVQGPVTLGWPATVLKWLRGIPFVYNIQDMWPDSLISTGMFNSGVGVKLIHHICKFIYNRASRIAVIAPGMKTRLIERGISGSKIELVYNWCDAHITNAIAAPKAVADELGFTGKFNIVFAGNIGKAQALESVIEAAELVQEICPVVQFVLIGSGVDVDVLKRQVVEKNLKNVIFHDRMPMAEIGAVLKLADVLLVHLRKDPLFEITIPSKTQAYMAIGKSILMAVNGDAANVVKNAGAGIVCEPQNPQDIAYAVKKLFNSPVQELDKMGNNGRIFYDNEMSFEIGIERFEKQFNLARR